MDCARVCVEVDVSKEVPDTLRLRKGTYHYMEIDAETPWLPPRCKKCHVFGHECREAFEEKERKNVHEISVEEKSKNNPVMEAAFSSEAQQNIINEVESLQRRRVLLIEKLR
ncbi:hypothetical protein CRG98_025315 [Punica granatum]|uniref:Zinc knuckle CX2CX4HX4C domain-containing protein n=1 Tax=Punica granatum TaxID=22663 RepID=A0A2I0JEE5_PUNGR|nr:hypothetical protein CRG98_025315 [Punica granatum]